MPSSEWIIMECLWDKAPMTVTQIAKVMEEQTGWAKSTTKTLISRMTAKGYLRFREGDKARVSIAAFLGRKQSWRKPKIFSAVYIMAASA